MVYSAPSFGETLYTVTPFSLLPYSSADSINASGQVTGSACENRFSGAYVYSGGVLTYLATRLVSAGHGINELGQVVGESATPGRLPPGRAFFSAAPPFVEELGTLGGPSSAAFAINNASQITGQADLPGGTAHAFVYSNGVMTDIGTLSGGLNSVGYAINSLGQIVGYSARSGGISRAFIYNNGAMTDLNLLIDPALGITLNSANGINDSGQIIAGGTVNGAYGPLPGEVFLLTPASVEVPEPSSLAVFASAICALAATRRRTQTADIVRKALGIVRPSRSS